MRPLAALSLLALFVSTNEVNAMIIAQNGKSRYTIVISQEASPSEVRAAGELQRFLREISGAELPIAIDDQKVSGPLILVGQSKPLAALRPGIRFVSLGNEGFTIKTVGPHLILAGGRLRGSMYAVYSFLEDQLGCRWYSSKISFIPQRKTVKVGALSITHKPRLAYREPFYTDAFDDDWAARNKANGHHQKLDEQRGGKVSYSHFVHTFSVLVPPGKYFQDHPEYFSEVNGKRIAQDAQLCLTNPDVVRIATDTVLHWIAESPEATIFSVSQNDCHGFCTCANCKALDDREGSHAGTMIAFVNAVAEQVEKKYPDKLIDTLAYQYTRKPPKTIVPRKNVLVRLCSIECCFSHPLETCPVNASFRDDIVGWSKKTNRLYIWDYVTDFPHYIMPFPNWDVLAPNIRFFVNHGVEGIFEEGNYSAGGGGEMAELRAYVLAKLLWNPDANPEAMMKDFVHGYYGAAWQPIWNYLNLSRRQVHNPGMHMNIWAKPDAPYLTDVFIDRSEELFDWAERLAANDKDLLLRVQVARLPIRYVRINRRREPNRDQMIDQFGAMAKAAGITNLREWQPQSLDEVLSGWRKG